MRFPASPRAVCGTFRSHRDFMSGERESIEPHLEPPSTERAQAYSSAGFRGRYDMPCTRDPSLLLALETLALGRIETGFNSLLYNPWTLGRVAAEHTVKSCTPSSCSTRLAQLRGNLAEHGLIYRAFTLILDNLYEGLLIMIMPCYFCLTQRAHTT
ncbi:hypothetical protein BDV29DRAFT_77951 [Aspergillus leporis]|jgi:hypothetical protein|uniref:Uncharacterized protein n=1 Tax=Aspergillus leporis TaxID=41062 RepID=A0A5N5XC99_9EURO|nr:hypothetical protein BDV29DRAFT_77951 [Aspergillus leporis]